VVLDQGGFSNASLLFLADAATVADGELNALGIGWDKIVPGAPFVICGTIGVPCHLATVPHPARFDLIDGDGEAFYLPAGDGEPEPFHPEMVSGVIRDIVGKDVKPKRDQLALHREHRCRVPAQGRDDV
jgi:hypothetical protein